MPAMLNGTEDVCLARAFNTSSTPDTSLTDEAAVVITQAVTIALAFLAVRLTNKYKVPLLPECGAVILVGFILGGILLAIDFRFVHLAAKFNADAFLLIILPPIIFDAGFSLTSSRSSISSNTGTILLLALAGTLISTIAVGTLLYLMFGESSSVWQEPSARLWEAYAFGSLISAVDPVATLAVLNEVFPKTKPDLFYLVFGESVINDAVSIVLYEVCIDQRHRKVTGLSFLEAFQSFWFKFIGSMLIGILMSALSALLFRAVNLRNHPSIELVAFILFPLGMYSISEFYDLSGIMTIFVGGRLMKHWTHNNLSVANRLFVPRLLKAMAETCETYVFAFLGAAFWSYQLEFNFAFIFATFACILFGRALNIFPLCFLSNKFRNSHSKRITAAEQIFMWFSGLRGAIAFALASYGRKRCDLHASVVTTTLMTVMATVFIFGGLAKPLLKHLNLAPEAPSATGMRPPSPSHMSAESDAPLITPEPMRSEDDEQAVGAAFAPPPQIHESDAASPVHRAYHRARSRVWRCFVLLLELDTRYVKPLLCRDHSPVERRRERLATALLKESGNEWVLDLPGSPPFPASPQGGEAPEEVHVKMHGMGPRSSLVRSSLVRRSLQQNPTEQVGAVSSSSASSEAAINMDLSSNVGPSTTTDGRPRSGSTASIGNGTGGVGTGDVVGGINTAS